MFSSFRCWKKQVENIQRKKHLLGLFIDGFFYFPQLQLRWKQWKIVCFTKPSLDRIVLKKVAFTSWKKNYEVNRYFYYYRLASCFKQWTEHLFLKDHRVFLNRRKRTHLYHLLLKKFRFLCELVKSGFLYWRFVTLSSYYSMIERNRDHGRLDDQSNVNWRHFVTASSDEPSSVSTYLLHPLYRDLLQRRNHSKLLEELQMSQVGRVLLMSSTSVESVLIKKGEIDHSSLINQETSSKSFPHQLRKNVKLPVVVSVLSHFYRECQDEASRIRNGKVKLSQALLIRKSTLLYQQESMLSDGTIPLREKLSYFLMNEKEGNLGGSNDRETPISRRNIRRADSHSRSLKFIGFQKDV
jgi:hypothetical protein